MVPFIWYMTLHNWIPKFHFEAMQRSHLLEQMIAKIHRTYIKLHQFLVLYRISNYEV